MVVEAHWLDCLSNHLCDCNNCSGVVIGVCG